MRSGAFSIPLWTSREPPRRAHCAFLPRESTSLTRKGRIDQIMRALLLPIKDLRNAKRRLIGFMSPEERFGLAQAMLADTFRSVRSVRRADKVFVATNYPPAM